MDYKITITGTRKSIPGPGESVWLQGTVANYQFSAKVYNGPSKYGINESCVSKLTVWAESERQRLGDPVAASIIHYDRGWIKEPDREDNGLLESLVAYLSAISFENLK